MTISTIEFSKKDARKLSSKTLRKIQSRMKRDGAIAFTNLFFLPMLKKIRADVMRRHGSGELRKNGLVRDIAGRYAAVLPFEGPFLDPKFYANSIVGEMMGALLGSGYCIGSLEVVVAIPGAYEQHQHIDGPIRFDRVIGKKKIGFEGDLSDLPPYAVSLCVPLCDVNEDNGPTAIWPGSHRSALRARPPGAREVSREFPVEHMAGDFGRSFLFDFRTYHCGMPNLTPEPRPLLVIVFTRSWYRDPNQAEVYPNVVVSKRALDRIPERYRHLFMLAPAARRQLWEKKAKR